MEIMGPLRRTHYALEILKSKIGDEVTVAGFVARSRDLGNLIFTDVRDVTGIIQLAFDDATEPGLFEKAKTLHNEYTLIAKGVVRERSSKTDKIPTGSIEIFVTDMRVLSGADVTPFEIRDEVSVRDDLALTYRYLDLRRPSLNEAIVARHKIVKTTRDFFSTNHFIEIETPFLIRSTPEGARDYLVPSRVQTGKFYALPQSPQLYKQLLMLSGFDRYMQIARCFRDEDLRADRQPEFTQIDLEMSFVDIDDILEMNERYIKYLFKEILDIDVSLPLPRMTYNEAMGRFGSDKPDTRFGMEIADISDCVSGGDFAVFSSAISAGGSVRAINAKGLAQKITRKEIDKLTEHAKTYRAKGLAYTRITDDARSSSYEKFLSESEIESINQALGAETGDVIFIISDAKTDVVLEALGALRCEIAKKFDVIEDAAQFNMLWVTEFPLFEYSEEDDRYYAKHHPFTMIMDEDVDKLESDPVSCRAKAYDMVINGNEIGGGSIRINNPEFQRRMFKALGFSEQAMHEQFGFLIDAYRYGAPPHGGLAFGLDRLVMLMLGKDSIRDVIAFPKVQNAGELMTGSPSHVDQKQLDELKLKLD